jgi:hypothetical protein
MVPKSSIWVEGALINTFVLFLQNERFGHNFNLVQREFSALASHSCLVYLPYFLTAWYETVILLEKV